MTELYLALDQGGHASRALLYDASGQLVRQAFAPIDTRRSQTGHVEHDPEQLIASLRTAIDTACRNLGPNRRIVAAGLATQRSSLCCWNRHTGAALSPVISWQDRRNADWLARLAPHAARIRALTGLVMTPHYGASKLRWCLDHLDAVQAAARAGELVLGPLASFILARLLPNQPLLADPANASRTQLWDVDRRDWSAELCALFDIDRALLPRAVASRCDYGMLPTPVGPVPLTVCTGDQSAVPFAFGPLDPATAYVNVGTGAFAQRAAGPAMPAAPRLLVSVVWSEANHVDYMLEGTVNGAGSALDWLAAEQHVPIEPLVRELDKAAEMSPPLFLNGVSGLGAPFWRSDFPCAFIGDSEPLLKVAAIIESIAFLLQANLDEMAPLGPPLKRILLTGGLAQGGYFRRTLSALTQLPLAIPHEPEATARGLARLLAADAGAPFASIPTEEIAPRADPPLHARYRRWRQEMARALG